MASKAIREFVFRLPIEATRVGSPSGAFETPSGEGHLGAKWVLGIFTLALLLRTLHLIAFAKLPFFHIPIIDGRGYWLWAGRLVQGDWMGRSVFYQAPLYPYLLGLLRALGADLVWVRTLQAVLGAGSCAVLAFAGNKLFGRRVGIIAGLLLACYAPAVFYDLLLQKANLALFLTALLIGCLGLADSRSSFWRWLGCGLVWALLSLTREHALLLLAPLGVWLFHKERKHARVLLTGSAFLLGALLVLGPTVLRNYWVGGQIALTTSQAGTNFYIGNHAGASGVYQPLIPFHGDPAYEARDATRLAERALGRQLTPSEVSQYWFGQAWKFVRKAPGAWLRLLARKAAILLSHREISDGIGYDHVRAHSPVLGLLGYPFHFGLLIPLAVLGVTLCWPPRRGRWILHLCWSTFALALILFFILGRYRLPLVPLACIFAATAIDCLIKIHTGGKARRRMLVVGGTLTLGVGILCNWPVATPRDTGAAAYANLGYTVLRDGKMKQAQRFFQQALAFSEGTNAAMAYHGMGVAQLKEGDTGAAIGWLRRAVTHAPHYGQAHYNLGLALLRENRSAEAVAVLRRATELRRDHAPSYFEYAVALARTGRLDQALVACQNGLRVRPGHAHGKALLAQLLAQGAVN